ncbi:DUF2069 domain-containing protein [Massilia sp. W12]|uniref:DUF2069 domain-containing protein n=1 Tax=Massilia sp. W12 TaxID=3126507 RepID=UPI0030CC0C83
MLDAAAEKRANRWHACALYSLIALIALCLAWELWLAPAFPGQWWPALKVLPLFIPLRGVYKRNIYTMQWSSMFILLYFTEGVVRGYSDLNRLSVHLAQAEIALVLLYFLACLLYLRPYKQAAKRAAKEALARARAQARESSQEAAP